MIKATSLLTTFLLLMTSTVLAACFSPAYGAEGSAASGFPEERLRIGRMALSYPHAPGALLERMGLLEEQGITNYEIHEFSAGSTGALALGTGAIDMIFFGAAIPPIVEGMEARIVALNNSGGVALVCMTPGIESLDDLRGKRVANIGPTASPTTVFDLSLARAGVPHDEVTHVSINRNSIVLALTQQRAVDCLAAMHPLTHEAVKQGAYFVLDERAIYADGNYPLTFFAARKDIIDNKRDVVEAVLRAHGSAQKFISDSPGEAIHRIGEYFDEQGVHMSEADLATGLAAHGFHQYISRSVMEDMVQAMFDAGVIRKLVAFEDLVDCSFGQCVE